MKFKCLTATETEKVGSFTVAGDLHSVNPLALKYRQDIFIKNERRVSILETEHFGKLAYIEVGATLVGKIVQFFDESKPFKKGDEKGYFLFGGSTVVLCGEKGKWAPSSDMLKNTKGRAASLPQGHSPSTRALLSGIDCK